MPTQRKTTNKTFTPLGDLFSPQLMVPLTSNWEIESPNSRGFGKDWRWWRVSIISSSPRCSGMPMGWVLSSCGTSGWERKCNCISSQNQVKYGAAKTSCWIHTVSWDCGVFGKFPLLPPPGRMHWHKRYIIYRDYRERYVYNRWLNRGCANVHRDTISVSIIAIIICINR